MGNARLSAKTSEPGPHVIIKPSASCSSHRCLLAHRTCHRSADAAAAVIEDFKASLRPLRASCARRCRHFVFSDLVGEVALSTCRGRRGSRVTGWNRHASTIETEVPFESVEIPFPGILCSHPPVAVLIVSSNGQLGSRQPQHAVTGLFDDQRHRPSMIRHASRRE